MSVEKSVANKTRPGREAMPFALQSISLFPTSDLNCLLNPEPCNLTPKPVLCTLTPPSRLSLSREATAGVLSSHHAPRDDHY